VEFAAHLPQGFPQMLGKFLRLDAPPFFAYSTSSNRKYDLLRFTVEIGAIDQPRISAPTIPRSA